MKNLIIIPTYNERENIEALVGEIFSILPDVNILIVDDSSPDGTADVVRNLKNIYPRLELLKKPQKNGLGGAYVEGFKKALEESEVRKVVMMDGDFSHNPKYLPLLFEESENHSLVVGSRYVSSGNISQWELWRKILSAGGNFYVRTILGRQINDWTGGFNCIQSEFLRKVDFEKIDLSGYAFIMGVKYALLKAGAVVKEIPITFEARRGGESKISRHIISEGIIAPWKIIFKQLI